MPSLQHIAQRLKAELGYYRCLITHPRTPRTARWLLGAAVAYFLTPIDIIPDFIPVLGHLDDIVVVPGLIWLGLRLVPENVKSECRQRLKPLPGIDSSPQRG